MQERTDLRQAFEDVKTYLAGKPTQKDNLIEALEFNVEGLQAEIEDRDFDWTKSPANMEIANDVLGDILMDYTIKASYEDIIELDKYLIDKLEKGE